MAGMMSPPDDGPLPYPDNPGVQRESDTLKRLFFKYHLDRHGLQIQCAAFSVSSAVGTPAQEFTARKARYTVAIGFRRITRETTCDRLAIEIAAYLADKKAKLVGIDGVNGFQCGATEEELRMFAHPLEDESSGFPV